MLFSAVSSSTVFAAEDYGTFSNWNSDATSIGFLKSTTVKAVFVAESGFDMSNSTFTTAGSYAMNEWADEFDFTISAGTTSSYTQMFIGVSRDSASDNYGLPANAEAATAPSRTKVGTANSGAKSVYQITKNITYVVWDDSTSYNTDDYSTSKWKAIFTHEFGHSIGYFGHDDDATSSSKSLMTESSSKYFGSWSVKTPQSRDTKHMSNVY